MLAEHLQRRAHAHQAGRTPTRPRPLQRLAPGAHRQRGARSRDPLPTDEHHGDVRTPGGLPEPECLRERQPWRTLPRIEGDERKPWTTRQKIEGGHGGLATTAAADPQDALERDARARRACGIERGVGIHERGRSAGRGDVAERGDEETGSAGRERPDDLRDFASL